MAYLPMKKHSLLYWVSIAVCSTGILLCGLLILSQQEEYRTGELAYGTLAETVINLPEPTHAQSSEHPEQPQQEEPILQVDFDALKNINPDVVGWLYCPNTVISYPVVQGEDNVYYLNHLFDGRQNSSGCLFLDSRCEGWDGKNSVIYGHHMKNGTLFASLENYQDPLYYEAHPRLFLLTPDSVLTIDLFSAYVTSEESDSWKLDFSSQDEFESWIDSTRERSCFDSNIIPQVSDQIITLSTCNYTFANARFVCHGVLRKVPANS